MLKTTRVVGAGAGGGGGKGMNRIKWSDTHSANIGKGIKKTIVVGFFMTRQDPLDRFSIPEPQHQFL